MSGDSYIVKRVEEEFAYYAQMTYDLLSDIGKAQFDRDIGSASLYDGAVEAHFNTGESAKEHIKNRLGSLANIISYHIHAGGDTSPDMFVYFSKIWPFSNDVTFEEAAELLEQGAKRYDNGLIHLELGLMYHLKLQKDPLKLTTQAWQRCALYAERGLAHLQRAQEIDPLLQDSDANYALKELPKAQSRIEDILRRKNELEQLQNQ